MLIFDLGRENFHIFLVTLNEDIFKVKATKVHTHLGGEDIDNRLVEFFIAEFKKKTEIDITTCATATTSLRTQCEKAKRVLSAAQQASIECETNFHGKNLTSSISRP